MKHLFIFLAMISGASYASITNLGLGSISMSTTNSNILNVVSLGVLDKIKLGGHYESDVNSQYKLSVLAQAPDGTIFGGDSQDGLLIRYDNNSNATVVHTFSSSSGGGTIPINLMYRNGYIIMSPVVNTKFNHFIEIIS